MSRWMLVAAAMVSITFETSIYWSGDIGRAFAEALAERARQGVKVHVLLTSVGSTHFDNRSFRLNDEATLNIVDNVARWAPAQ